MCGIVGVLSSEMNTHNHPYGKFFKQALFTDTLRGVDSTGVMLLDGKKQTRPEVWKKALAAYDFLQLARTNTLLRDTLDYNVMIGHNRAATRGSIDHHTAHPFQFGDITLVHNGTLHNHRSLAGCSKYEVDSEAVAHSFHENGVEETIKKLDGAFTFIWHDQQDQSVSIIRNEERPIAFGKVKDKDTILLSSEAAMLRWLAIRNGLALESIVEPKAGELFTFWPHKDNKKWTETYVTKTLELKQKHVYNNYGNAYGDDYYGGTHNRWEGGKKQQPGSKNGKNGKDKNTGKGTVKQLHADAIAILKMLGLKDNEPVVIENLKFEEYVTAKEKRYGQVVGTVLDNDIPHKAVIHGVLQTTWNKDLTGDVVVLGEINGAAYDANNIRQVYISNRDFAVFPRDELPKQEEKEVAEDDGETFRGLRGAYFTRSGWLESVQGGCCYCSGDINIEDAEKTGWTESGDPVCKNCVADFNLGQYLG